MRYPSPYSLALLLIALSSASLEARKPGFVVEQVGVSSGPTTEQRFRLSPQCSRKSKVTIRDQDELRQIQQKLTANKRVKALLTDKKAEQVRIVLHDSSLLSDVSAILSEKSLWMPRMYKNLGQMTLEIKSHQFIESTAAERMLASFNINPKNFPRLGGGGIEITFSCPAPQEQSVTATTPTADAQLDPVAPTRTKRRAPLAPPSYQDTQADSSLYPVLPR